ncbi:MAG: glycosyltransferase family 2 protein [Elusimicrobia bacterium]|nr:glycosyltransferase family 2 protein [Elusimicrobiota bacterium]
MVMPNYNHGHYIREALAAFLSQSFKPMEIIIVDDASTDNSIEILEELCRNNPTLHLVRNERNMGVMASANRAARMLSGDYAQFSAADDRILPGFLEQSIGLLSRYPQAGLCSTLSLMLGKDGQNLGPYQTPVVAETECYLPPARIAAIYRKNGSWVVPNTVIFRREAILEFGCFDPALGPSADGFLHHAVSLKYGACFIPRPLAMWRQMETNYSWTYTADFRASMDMVGRMEHRMRHQYRDLFPPDYVDLFKLRAMRSQVHGMIERNPYRHDQILEVGKSMRLRRPLDKMYFAGLRLCLEVGLWATKLYILLQHPFPDQARIILRKLRRLVSGA